MVIVKRSLSTRPPISILANVPRDRALNRGVTLGPRPPQPTRPAKSKVVVGNVQIERFDSGIAISHKDSTATPLRLSESEVDELVVALDRVVNDRVTRPSPSPRPAPLPGRGQQHDAATAFRQANRAMVKVGS